MDEILISRSTDFSDYEIIIRQRGNYEYTAFCPQINFMVKADDIITAKELLVKRINEHINYNLANPEVVEEYYRKLEGFRLEKEEFYKKNLLQNQEVEEETETEETEDSEAEDTGDAANQGDDNSNMIDDDFLKDMNIDLSNPDLK